ncbi:MAG: hypothetical protein R3E79_53990 [Caldilineaceae bacterium]
MSKAVARERTVELLRHVGIALPEQRVDEYAYQLSGRHAPALMIASGPPSSPNC